MFERGSTQVFTVTSPVSVGEPVSLHIEHDNSGFAPAWFLDHVAVHMADRTTFFPCHLWLALDVGDGKIARTLHPVLDRPTSAQGVYVYMCMCVSGVHTVCMNVCERSTHSVYECV